MMFSFSKRFGILILGSSLFALAHCHHDRVARRVRVQPLGVPANIGRVAVISRFEVQTPDERVSSPRDTKVLYLAVRNAVLNSRQFQAVYYRYAPPQPNARRPRYHLHLVLQPVVKKRFIWGLTWPAVYPLPGLWPFQLRKGTIEVQARLRVFRGSRLLKSVTFTEYRSFSILMYGYYRTGPIEAKLLSAYQDTMEELTKILLALELDAE